MKVEESDAKARRRKNKDFFLMLTVQDQDVYMNCAGKGASYTKGAVYLWSRRGQARERAQGAFPMIFT